MAGHDTSMMLKEAAKGAGNAAQTLRRVAPTAPELRTAEAPPPPRAVCRMCWQTFAELDAASCPECSSLRPDSGWDQLPLLVRDRYRFTKLLGRGAQGAVFKATDLYGEVGEEGEPPAVAVKVVQQVGGESVAQQLRELFAHEASVAALLGQSPYFVRTMGYEVGALPFLVMECMAWPTLKKVLEPGPLTPLQVAHLGLAMLEAIEVMHYYRMVHRDLKPSNMFVQAEQGHYLVKIADLGIWTRDHDAQLPGSVAPDTKLFIGTLGYMSPEQMACEPVGCRSDLHTIGSILWEAATGSVPFPVVGNSIWEQVAQRKRAVRTLPPRPASMPEALYAILGHALAWAVEQRPATARALLEELAGFARDVQSDSQYSANRMRQELAELNEAVEALQRPLAEVREQEQQLEGLRSSIRSLLGYLEGGGTIDSTAYDDAVRSARRKLAQIRDWLTNQLDSLPDPSLSAPPVSRADQPAAPQAATANLPAKALKQRGAAEEADQEALFNDRYEIVSLLDMGSAARIYVARQKALRRKVALKVLNQSSGEGLPWDQQVRLFQAQAQALSLLRHPNIVRIYDMGMVRGGYPYTALEFLEGEILSTLLQREPALPEHEVLRLFEPVAAALHDAHSQGVLHLNLKPSNIFLRDTGSGSTTEPDTIPVVLSFGLPQDQLHQLLPQGMLLGTPRYMAPEQIVARPPTPGTDLYALGTILYELLAGRPPYEESTGVREMLSSKLRQPSPPVPVSGPAGPISAPLRSIIEALLLRQPRLRLSDARTVQGWFRALQQGVVEAIPLADLQERRRQELALGDPT